MRTPSPHLRPPTSILTFFLVISVNVFYRINQERPSHHDAERAMQEKEFKIGSVGFADSTGILLASLLAMPTEIGLCQAQVDRGKMLCREL